LPLLQLLAPRSSSHFTPEQLAIIGEPDGAVSKKSPELRNAELLKAALPALQTLCIEHPAELARSAHGHAVLFETIAATQRSAAAGVDADTDALPVLQALAIASTSDGDGEGDLALPLVRHYVAARLLKRLIKQGDNFAELLLAQMRGALVHWSMDGAAWVVLALLEAQVTSAHVSKELAPALSEIESSDADGCRTLSAALKPLVGETPSKLKAGKIASSKKKAADKKM